MPTSAQIVFTEAALIPYMNPEDARMTAVRLEASKTFRAGDSVGEITATPGTYALYDDGASDGRNVARGLIKYACQTDSAGNISFGAGTAGDEHFATHLTAPMYYKGTFKTDDLPQSGVGQLDTNGMNDLQGHLVEGSLTSGILKF